MLTTVNTSELYHVLEYTPAKENIMIVGKHGIGKSEIVKTFFEKQGKKVVVVFCSQAADPGDIIGLPRYNPETGKTEFALPWWFPTDGNPVVLFLDELNRARPEILQVVMDLTLNRRLAGKDLPEGSQIISAINAGDEYQLTELDPALVSRFNVYNFHPTVQEWLNWAAESNLNTQVTSFIATNTKYLDPTYSEDYSAIDKTPDRRAWSRISDIMNLNPIVDMNLKKILSGIVGGQAAASFYESIRTSAIVTPEDILNDFNKVRGQFAKYTVQEYTGIIDNVCSYINTNVDILNGTVDKNDTDRYAANLLLFFQFLCNKDKGNKEAMAYFVTNYESGAYENFNMLVGTYFDTLESFINDFITSTATTR